MRRLEWSDLDDATRERAVTWTVRTCRVSRDEAEDVVASAVLRLMSNPPLVRNPKGLLIEASLNLLRTERRRHPRARALPADPYDADRESDADDGVPEPLDERADHVGRLIEEELRGIWSSRVHAAIDRMKPVDRSVLTAYYVEGRPLPSIDEARGDKPGTARMHVHRARLRLLRMLRSPDPSVGMER